MFDILFYIHTGIIKMIHNNGFIFKYNNRMQILRRKCENKCTHLREIFFSNMERNFKVNIYIFLYKQTNFY